MPTVPYMKPTFRMTGAPKEPVRLSFPPATGAVFLEGDFVTLGTANAAPSTNGTALGTPAAAPNAQGSTAAGSIPSGTYYVGITLLNANGETMVSPVQAVTLGATGQIIVTSPTPVGDATGYRIYVGTTPAALHLQGATTAIGATITQTTYNGAAAAPPAANATGLAAPAAPTTGSATSGSQGARTEYFTVTYVTDVGETVASAETAQVLTVGQVATVASPAASGDAIFYNVYGATISGQEVRQNASPIPLGTAWTEPATGLVLQGVQRAITNQPATIGGVPAILGLADHDSNAVYGGPVGGAQPGGLTPYGRPVWNASRYGVTENYPGIATEAKNAHVVAAASTEFEISLVQAWNPGFAGSLQVGLAIDAASGLFVADAAQSNKVATVVAAVDGPGRGGVGDTGKRVAIRFLGTAAVPV